MEFSFPFPFRFSVRSGDDWEEFAALIQRKTAAAFAMEASLIPVTVEVEEEDEEEEAPPEEPPAPGEADVLFSL